MPLTCNGSVKENIKLGRGILWFCCTELKHLSARLICNSERGHKEATLTTSAAQESKSHISIVPFGLMSNFYEPQSILL